MTIPLKSRRLTGWDEPDENKSRKATENFRAIFLNSDF